MVVAQANADALHPKGGAMSKYTKSFTLMPNNGTDNGDVRSCQ